LLSEIRVFGGCNFRFLITRYFYFREKSSDPGVLTDLKQGAVSNEMFSKFVIENNVYKYMKYQSQSLYNALVKWVNLMEDTNGKVIYSDFEAPKVLGDIWESIAGAIFIDCGNDLEIVWQVYYPLMKNVLENELVPGTIPIHPIREVIRFVQSHTCSEFEFEDTSPSFEEKSKSKFFIHGKLIGIGAGNSKKRARKNSSREALLYLNKYPNFMKEVCDCEMKREKEKLLKENVKKKKKKKKQSKII